MGQSVAENSPSSSGYLDGWVSFELVRGYLSMRRSKAMSDDLVLGIPISSGFTVSGMVERMWYGPNLRGSSFELELVPIRSVVVTANSGYST